MRDSTADKLLVLKSHLMRTPVIAGLKNIRDVYTAAAAGIRICFFLTGTIFELREIAAVTRENDQLLFAHVDLIQGVAKDASGIRLLAEEVDIDGILTTKSHLIRVAKDHGLLAIQRLFMLDSEALRTALHILKSSHPHAVEILPALILPNIRRRLPDDLPPVIGGGLVETVDELKAVLQAPVLAVSTSNHDLWKLSARQLNSETSQ